jgi:hypothetical protein
MEDKVQVKLLEDIYSGGKGKRLYGSKNQTVSLVSIFSNVLIVQAECGNKFPVKTELTDFKI